MEFRKLPHTLSKTSFRKFNLIRISRLYSAIFLMVLIAAMSGCGYTNRAILPNNIRSIAIPPFENKISPQETFTYETGIEIDVTEAVIDRILFDGNLKVVDIKKADARLEGKLVAYYQEATRFDALDGVTEYRLYLVCKLKLIDQRTNTVIWEEPSFSGDTEYFISGASAKPESSAVKSVMIEFAKNVVNRIVEDW